MELVLIPPGKFIMGSPEAERYPEQKETHHEVMSSNPFYMGKYEVTQEQYETITGTNPAWFKGAKNPMEGVSWKDAQDFCRKLSAKMDKTVVLPTEAQWEYACRAGTTTTYYTGDAESDLERAAWYLTNSNWTTHPVGQKEPNAWGLYDTYGNVWEWCQSRYEPYKAEATYDPQCPPDGNARVLHGGSWYLNPWFCRSAIPPWNNPVTRLCDVGFRVVVLAPRTP